MSWSRERVWALNALSARVRTVRPCALGMVPGPLRASFVETQGTQAQQALWMPDLSSRGNGDMCQARKSEILSARMEDLSADEVANCGTLQ